MKKRLVLGVAGLACCVALMGCSMGAGSGSTQGGGGTAAVAESAEPKKDAIKVDEIDWKAEQGVEDGKRRILFSFENNSQYEIAALELDFKFKDDVTSEDLQDAYSDILDSGTSEDDLLEWTTHGDSPYLVKPGESSTPLAFETGIWYVTSMDQYDLVEPDMMTIMILHDGKLYEEYYDYQSDSYSMSSDVIDTSQWSDSELASAIPQPKNLLVTDLMDSKGQFSFDTISTSSDDYNGFIDSCKDAGFTANVTSGDSFYYADNEDGTYHIDVMYSDSLGHMTAYVSPAKKE